MLCFWQGPVFEQKHAGHISTFYWTGFLLKPVTEAWKRFVRVLKSWVAVIVCVLSYSFMSIFLNNGKWVKFF